MFVQFPQKGCMCASCPASPLLGSVWDNPLVSSKEEPLGCFDKKCQVPSIVNLYESPVSAPAVITRVALLQGKGSVEEEGNHRVRKVLITRIRGGKRRNTYVE